MTFRGEVEPKKGRNTTNQASNPMEIKDINPMEIKGKKSQRPKNSKERKGGQGSKRRRSTREP